VYEYVGIKVYKSFYVMKVWKLINVSIFPTCIHGGYVETWRYRDVDV